MRKRMNWRQPREQSQSLLRSFRLLLFENALVYEFFAPSRLGVRHAFPTQQSKEKEKRRRAAAVSRSPRWALAGYSPRAATHVSGECVLSQVVRHFICVRSERAKPAKLASRQFSQTSPSRNCRLTSQPRNCRHEFGNHLISRRSDRTLARVAGSSGGCCRRSSGPVRVRVV